MIIKTPSPLSAIRLHRQREEKEAFQAYAAALKKWERARDRADDAAWEFQLACAELQQKTIAGTPNGEITLLRRHCRKLQENSRRLQSASAEAKAEASTAFTVLVNARTARQELEGFQAGEFESAGIIVPFGARGVDVPHCQWN